MTGKKHFVLGLFVVLVLALLGYYTLFLRDFSLFRDRAELAAYFEDAQGLRQGDAVLVAGVRWGRVEQVVYHPEAERERRILVTMFLDEAIRLHEGAAIRIESATMLGGRHVTIDPGPPAAPLLDPDATIFGSVTKGALDEVGNFVRDNQETVSQALVDIRELVAGLREGRGVIGALLVDDAMRDDLATTLGAATETARNLSRISDDLVAGRGTIGRLLAEEKVYELLTEVGERLSAVAEEAQGVMAAARTGDGLVARLLNDAELSEDAAATVRSLREIVDGINRGEGTLGVLVREDGIARRVEELLTGLTEGEGTLSRLLTSDELYADLRRVSEDLAAIVAHVRSGEGSIGKLVMDDDLYLQLQRGAALLTRSLEEYREAAPISTMTSVLFSAF